MGLQFGSMDGFRLLDHNLNATRNRHKSWVYKSPNFGNISHFEVLCLKTKIHALIQNRVLWHDYGYYSLDRLGQAWGKFIPRRWGKPCRNGSYIRSPAFLTKRSQGIELRELRVHLVSSPLQYVLYLDDCTKV